jgi:transposase-like protein
LAGLDRLFKGRQFTAEVILWAVRWYLMSLLSASGVVKSGPDRWAEEAWCASTGGSG